jgi:hypothetical protein
LIQTFLAFQSGKSRRQVCFQQESTEEEQLRNRKDKARKIKRTDKAEHAIKKGPAKKQGLSISLGLWLTRDYIGCTRAFFALSDFELDLLAFIE